MCLYPIYIRNKKYTITKKNKGIVPKCNDIRTSIVAIGCGICEECRRKRANEWKVRLMEEIKHDNNAWFVTLTFSEKEYQKLYQESEAKNDEEMLTYTIRRFKERVRKQYGKAKKMWLIQEYGEDYDRVHLHGLIWDMDEKSIEKRWSHGFTYLGNDISEKTINYIIKYCLKTDTKRPKWKPKIWCSPGLGKDYSGLINKYQGEKTREVYICKNGARVGLPMYFRNKLYNEDQREALWINLLNKNVRYIHGTPYYIGHNKGLKTWRDCLKTAQRENERKKYGYVEDWETKTNRNNFNINKLNKELYNTIESCIFAFENSNTNTNEGSKSKLRNLQMHKTLAEHSNMGHRHNNGNHGSLQKTDALTRLRLCNNRNKRAGETDRKDTNLQAERNQTTIINNLKTYNNGQRRNQNLERWGPSKGNTNRNKKQPLYSEYDRGNNRGGIRKMSPEIETRGFDTNQYRGYEVIDIDTGEIYTKVEYTRIKNQLKTISYEKRSRRGTKADGSRYTWYETRRLVRKIGKEQIEIDFD